MYGGSATGGVINIITKRDYSGLNIYALYGNTFHSDVDRLEFGVDGGFNFNKGRTKVTFRASRQARDDLLGIDRPFARRALERFIENDPTSSGIRSTAYGVLPNVFSSNGSNLVLDAVYGGQPLNSPWTSIPEGYAGFLTDNAAALLNNAGKLHLEGRPAVLSRSPTVNSAGLDMRHEFSPSLEAFASSSWSKSITEGSLPHSFALTLQANSPNNPFQQNIVVNVSLDDLRFRTASKSSSLFLNAGLIKRFSQGWTASLEYAWSRSRSSFESTTSFSPSAAALPIIQGALLRDWHLFPSSELEGLFNLQRTNQSTKITLQDYSLRLGGPVVGLPAGPATLTALIEYRDEAASQSTLRSELQPFPVDYIWFPPASQGVWSAYAEIRAPIFSQKNSSPLFRALELMAAIRHDSYSIRFAGDTFLLPGPHGPFPLLDYSHSKLNFTDYTLGVLYKPVLGVELRGSFGTGSLPPTLSQIRKNLTTVLASTTGFLDPKRGGEVLIGDPTSSPPGLLEQSITGGAGLKPEQSRSLHIGAVLEPAFLEPLRLSIDYVEIKKKGEIALFGGQYFLDNEDIYPDRVARGPRLPGDPVEWAGPVIFLDRSFVNIFKTKVRAVDFQADYSVKTSALGDWRFYLVGTRNLSFRSQRSLTSDPLNTIGASDGPLKWRGNVGIDWSKGGWAAGCNAQYFLKRSLCSESRLDADTCAVFNIVLAQGKDSVPDQIYHDIYVKYSFDQSTNLLNGTEVTFGIQNLLDKSPPIIARGGPYSLFGDPRLRRFTIAVRRHF
jgi:outer membrane receptor protein involved in Fe transport